MVEHYNNLTLKSLHMLKLYCEVYQQNQVKYLVKADEDSFINLPRLSKILETKEKTSNQNQNSSEYFILGVLNHFKLLTSSLIFLHTVSNPMISKQNGKICH